MGEISGNIFYFQIMKFLVVLAVIVGTASAQTGHEEAYAAREYPNPIYDPKECGRPEGQPSYICDPSLLLKPEEG
jgi:hypothetical protein